MASNGSSKFAFFSTSLTLTFSVQTNPIGSPVDTSSGDAKDPHLGERTPEPDPLREFKEGSIYVDDTTEGAYGSSKDQNPQTTALRDISKPFLTHGKPVKSP